MSNNSDSDFINKIVQIAQSGMCTNDDLKYFLPDNITHGHERIFKVSVREFPQLRDKNTLLDVIKGYHIIERKHGGFGSPSCTKSLINHLIKIDLPEGKKIYDWVAQNGGNYYIEPNVSYDESVKKSQAAAHRRAEILENDQKTHTEAVERKKQKEYLHKLKSEKDKVVFNEFIDRFQKMSDGELIEAFNKDIGPRVWITARERFHHALQNEFRKRGIDNSAIADNGGLKLNKKIKLEGRKIIVLP